VGCVQALHRLLQLDPEPDRVAEPGPAEVGLDARLDRSDRLRVRVPGGHVELLPDRRELLLADAEQVDSLAAGHLDHRDLVLVDDVGDPPQLIRARHAATHPRHDAEPPVVLDVGVDAVVDEPGVALLPARSASPAPSAPSAGSSSSSRCARRASRS
jgi:hypothetical protein